MSLKIFQNGASIHQLLLPIISPAEALCNYSNLVFKQRIFLAPQRVRKPKRILLYPRYVRSALLRDV